MLFMRGRVTVEHEGAWKLSVGVHADLYWCGDATSPLLNYICMFEGAKLIALIPGLSIACCQHHVLSQDEVRLTSCPSATLNGTQVVKVYYFVVYVGYVLYLFFLSVVCPRVAGLADVNKVKIAWVTAASSETKPLVTGVTCWSHWDASVC